MTIRKRVVAGLHTGSSTSTYTGRGMPRPTTRTTTRTIEDLRANSTSPITIRSAVHRTHGRQACGRHLSCAERPRSLRTFRSMFSSMPISATRSQSIAARIRIATQRRFLSIRSQTRLARTPASILGSATLTETDTRTFFRPRVLPGGSQSGGITEWRALDANLAGIETLRASDLGFADIDNDGKTDVLACRGDGSLVYFSAGSGNPIVLTTSPVRASDLRFGDFDGDHKTDIFRRDDSTDWFVWFGNTRTWTVTGSSGFALSDLRFGDFDGDGRTDVMAVVDGFWSISRGAASAWAHYGPKFLDSLSKTVVGDFDGDGKADLAWADGDTWQFSSRGCVKPALLRDAGPFSPPLQGFRVGDFDRDGTDELLFYEWHIDTTTATPRLVFDKRLAALQARSTSVVYSRYEMR